jgi:hypothetical protein
MRRILTHVSEAELRLWLKIGEQALADGALSAARRTIASDQVAACHALLEGRGKIPNVPSDRRRGEAPTDAVAEDMGGNRA